MSADKLELDEHEEHECRQIRLSGELRSCLKRIGEAKTLDEAQILSGEAEILRRRLHQTVRPGDYDRVVRVDSGSVAELVEVLKEVEYSGRDRYGDSCVVADMIVLFGAAEDRDLSTLWEADAGEYEDDAVHQPSCAGAKRHEYDDDYRCDGEFVCAECKRICGYCYSQADDDWRLCDDCWGEKHQPNKEDA